EDALGGTIYAWLENPVKFEKSNGVNITLDAEIVQKSDNEEEETHILIVDSALHLRTFARWAEPMLIYFHPEQHGARPPHPPPGLFHGHLWLMHLKLSRTSEKDFQHISEALTRTQLLFLGARVQVRSAQSEYWVYFCAHSSLTQTLARNTDKN
uniref:Uncharacterized protein n=1 Tax=Labrus bergylta TaxID=56723 RepID=A0A3Q3FA35_9LABR